MKKNQLFIDKLNKRSLNDRVLRDNCNDILPLS